MRPIRLALAALLTVSGAALAAPNSDEDIDLKEERRALESRLDELGQTLRTLPTENQTKQRWAQWYNWGNWSNGFNNWRNW